MTRVIDVLLAIIVLLVLFPLFIVIALFVKFTSKGDVLFIQERVGLNGRLFGIYKFRTMIKDADKVGPYYTDVNDKRITKIGSILRKTSLDEIPQILNLLIGDMGIVGPRPNVYIQKKLYTNEEWNLRNSVRPGITGLAQATKRSSATQEERTALDLTYVSQKSFFMDVKIIFLTIKQIFRSGGY